MSKDSSLTAADAISITPSDTAPCNICALYVGEAGDVAVVTQKQGHHSSSSITFKQVPVGTIIYLHIAKVMATGTTATNLVGLCS